MTIYLSNHCAVLADGIKMCHWFPQVHIEPKVIAKEGKTAWYTFDLYFEPSPDIEYLNNIKWYKSEFSIIVKDYEKGCSYTFEKCVILDYQITNSDADLCLYRYTFKSLVPEFKVVL